jgi:hypothetical protein
MAEAEAAIRVVISSRTDPACRDQPGLLMTAMAELSGVVAIAAVRLARVRGAGMAAHETLRVEARLAPRVGAMTVEARRPKVTGLARLGSRVRLRAVPLLEVARMRRRRRANQLHAGCALGTSRGERRECPRRRPDVTGRAALARVAHGAPAGFSLRLAPVRAEKRGCGMAGWGSHHSLVRRSSIVEGKCVDHRRFRCVHVAGHAEIARVTGRAVRRDSGSSRRASRFREFAVSTAHEIGRGMRLRSWEARNVGPRESRCITEWHVTLRAGFCRRIDMRFLQLVAAEAVPDDRVLHIHPTGSGLVMTVRAGADQGAVSRIALARGTIVRLVGESPISGTRSDARLPGHARLGDPVVTCRAILRTRKHRGPRLHDAGMTRGAQREHASVPRVRERVISATRG